MKPQTVHLSCIHRHRSTLLSHKRLVRGAMLLEVLVAILILAFGILGIIGLQAKMTVNMSDARYRAEAAFLADQLIGLMWSDANGGFDGNPDQNNLRNYNANHTTANNPADLDNPLTCNQLSESPGGSSRIFTGWLGNITDPTPGSVYDLLPNPRVQVIVTTDSNSNNINNINRIVSQVVIVRLCWSAPNDQDSSGNRIWHHHRITTQILG